MNKKYVVRLTDPERDELTAVIKKLKGTSQKVRRAQVLLKADADGPNWADHRIAEAFGCRRQTVENIRQRLVERGFRETLDGLKRALPPVEKLLRGYPGMFSCILRYLNGIAFLDVSGLNIMSMR
jgi:hypothetical protein